MIMVTRITMLTKSKRIIFLAAIILFALLSTNVFAQTLKQVVYDDPVYLFLDKAYAKKWILYLPTSKPYTEKKVYAMLNEVLSTFKASPQYFSQRDIDDILFHMDRIAGDKYSLFSIKDDKFSASINAAPHVDFNTALDTPSDTATVFGADLIADLTLGNVLYLGFKTDQYLILETWKDSPYRKFHNPHYPDFNMYTYNLSAKTKGFNENGEHSPGDSEISIRMNQFNQMTIDLNLATISFGRNSLMWGASQFSNNFLSNTSKPYEYFSFDIPFGERMSFSWMTGFLKDKLPLRSGDDGKKLITAHKFEFQATDWLMFSIYEAVIYSQKFELAYMNPFSFYYIAEVAQGDYDNKLGGFDFVFRFAPATIYLSFYFDDWDFGELFNPSYYHNELITTLGARHYDLIPGLTIIAEGTYINHWTYTHKISNGKRNSYTHYATNLGNVLEPNSYMIYLDFNYDYSLKSTYGFSFWFTQHGYGSIYKHPSDPNEKGWCLGIYDPWKGNYKFLDYGTGYPRETNIDFALYTEYRIPYYGIKFYAELSAEYTRNKDNIKGENEWKCFLTLSAKWQAY
ncbi:MAG: capsule assembly Wzi family protein [Spirochaetaceae bacterium]|nr:capsule assembly Wzi family protein [Spirochaetaceae bacterium]